MSVPISYRVNQASAKEIADHLECCDASFVPRLSERVKIGAYAKKIVSRAMRFEAWAGDKLVGLIATYSNDQEQRIAYITSVSVLKVWTGKGIALHLIRQAMKHAKASGMRQISLEVRKDNLPAMKLYNKCGFIAGKTDGLSLSMDLVLKTNGDMK